MGEGEDEGDDVDALSRSALMLASLAEPASDGGACDDGVLGPSANGFLYERNCSLPLSQTPKVRAIFLVTQSVHYRTGGC